MKIRLTRLAAIIMAIFMMINVWAMAEGSIRTTVVMRVSHMTQNAVVDAGEDLSIEVNIDGVSPHSYQWYFNNALIDGANQKVLNIVNAQPADTGLYRMEAIGDDGMVLLSMDIAARVVEPYVPQSGDASMHVGYALCGMALCAAALAGMLRRRAVV